MSPIALPRCCAGQVSDTSSAPDAHSPPMPSPSSVRATASWVRFCARPDSPEQIENSSTVAISARLRPIRSAIAPNRMPPNDDANSVTVTMKPASAGLSFHSAMIDVRQNE